MKCEDTPPGVTYAVSHIGRCQSSLMTSKWAPMAPATNPIKKYFMRLEV